MTAPTIFEIFDLVQEHVFGLLADLDPENIDRVAADPKFRAATMRSMRRHLDALIELPTPEAEQGSDVAIAVGVALGMALALDDYRNAAKRLPRVEARVAADKPAPFAAMRLPILRKGDAAAKKAALADAVSESAVLRRGPLVTEIREP